jgi:23S rRNA pseudouridine1911/1915/1917 synthase
MGIRSRSYFQVYREAAMPAEKIEVIVPEEYHLQRVDIFLAGSLEMDLSRSYIQKLIKAGKILANGVEIRQNYRIRTDDIITIEIPEPSAAAFEAENIPLDIIYQDDSLAVINKPAGMVVHPGPGNWNRTLVNALLFHIKNLSGIGGTERPGIVHRLDKDTSGIILIAKDDRAHRFLADEFAGRRVVKRYIAVCAGKPATDHGIMTESIGRHPKYRHKMTLREDGREAITEFFLKRVWNTGSSVFSMFDILLHTGRTHQIRVHLSSRNLPIVGDPIYSKKWEKYHVPHLLLASVYLEFAHPRTGERMNFGIPLPEHIDTFIKRLDRQ